MHQCLLKSIFDQAHPGFLLPPQSCRSSLMKHKTMNDIYSPPLPGQLFLLSHAGLALHSSTVAQHSSFWYLMTALPFSLLYHSNTHCTTSQTPWISSFLREMMEDANPWPFKELQPAFLSWSPVRILSQAPITLQFRPKPKPCSHHRPVQLHSIWTCMQEALRGSFPFSGVSYHACP